MPRVKIDLPERTVFTCDIPVRVTDVNYGGHVGNGKEVARAKTGIVFFDYEKRTISSIPEEFKNRFAPTV